MPNELLKCRDLETLDVDHNFIEELPSGIENMPKMRYSVFTQTPEQVMAFRHLKYANNRLHQKQLAQISKKFPTEAAKYRMITFLRVYTVKCNK